MIVMAFVVIWLLVLIPLALRKHSEHRLISSVARFRRQRQLLERAYASHPNNRHSTSLVLIGRQGTGPPMSLLRRSIEERVAIRQRRRRLALTVLGSVFLLTLIIGFVPALRAFWAVAVIFAALMTAYIFLLARCVAAEANGAHSRHPLEAGLGRHAIPWNEELLSPSPATDADGADVTQLPSRVRLLLDERSA